MFLEAILAEKGREIAEKKRHLPLEELRRRAVAMPPTRDFLSAISSSRRKPALIAEIKLASPSLGSLCSRERAAALPSIYAAGGAACLSVVTDARFFGGDGALVAQAKDGAGLPVLRKDFVLDEYQVWEARSLGADAVLLIAACVTRKRLGELRRAAQEVGLPILCEVHNEEEVEAALSCQPEMIGINNRDLSTFQVSLETTLRLRPLIPDSISLVSESGFATRQDVLKVQEAGVAAILIGERLIKAEEPLRAIKELYGEDVS